MLGSFRKQDSAEDRIPAILPKLILLLVCFPCLRNVSLEWKAYSRQILWLKQFQAVVYTHRVFFYLFLRRYASSSAPPSFGDTLRLHVESSFVLFTVLFALLFRVLCSTFESRGELIAV